MIKSFREYYKLVHKVAEDGEGPLQYWYIEGPFGDCGTFCSEERALQAYNDLFIRWVGAHSR